jgi:hypothetical protein
MVKPTAKWSVSWSHLVALVVCSFAAGVFAYLVEKAMGWHPLWVACPCVAIVASFLHPLRFHSPKEQPTAPAAEPGVTAERGP